MTNKQAYQALSNANVHWDRKDNNHIVVWTSGYKTQDAYNIEKFLNQAGMQCLEMRFDKICGKTQAVYKHKKGGA